MRVAIYARYSSDLQSTASIEDQIRRCRERIAQENGTVVETYTDYAISGDSLKNRPGIRALLSDAKSFKFDCVIAEALDRISRDQEDIAGIYKRLRHADIRLVTLAESEISELHVGLKGTMNALFLKDLALKTHRGLQGRIDAGKSAGGLCYGYRPVHTLSADGEVIRGERRIEDAEVRERVFGHRTAVQHCPDRVAQPLDIVPRAPLQTLPENRSRSLCQYAGFGLLTKFHNPAILKRQIDDHAVPANGIVGMPGAIGAGKPSGPMRIGCEAQELFPVERVAQDRRSL